MVEKRRSSAVRRLDVPAGLHLLRYVSGPANSAPPTISLRARRRDEIDIIDPDGGFSKRLEGPGDFLILRASDDSVVEMTSEAGAPNGSIAANLTFQKFDNSVFRTPAQNSRTEEADWDDEEEDDFAPAASSSPELEVLGHLARRGDVIVQAGQWLGGPEAPAVIEGVEIRWQTRPRDLSLRYGVTPSSAGERRLVDAGSFVGSRGRARPVKFLEFELTGAAASRYELDVSAVFLGSPIKKIRGRNVVLRGPAGSEPLVGLCVALVNVGVAAGERRSASHEQGVVSRMDDARASEVRIFRRSGVRGKADGR